MAIAALRIHCRSHRALSLGSGGDRYQSSSTSNASSSPALCGFHARAGASAHSLHDLLEGSFAFLGGVALRYRLIKVFRCPHEYTRPHPRGCDDVARVARCIAAPSLAAKSHVRHGCCCAPLFLLHFLLSMVLPYPSEYCRRKALRCSLCSGITLHGTLTRTWPRIYRPSSFPSASFVSLTKKVYNAFQFA